jgi:hypothetical protein
MRLGLFSCPLSSLRKNRLAAQALRCRPLNEYVDYIPVLIDGPPEIVALTLDVHEDFVQMPHVS